MSILFNIIKGLGKGFINVLSNEEEEEEKRRNAIKELEKGNPEDYTDLYDYIDDDIINKEYPIEQEDEDQYD